VKGADVMYIGQLSFVAASYQVYLSYALQLLPSLGTATALNHNNTHHPPHAAAAYVPYLGNYYISVVLTCGTAVDIIVSEHDKTRIPSLLTTK
jgi:hypothetical protein